VKKYLVLITCFLSDLAMHCRAGSVVLLPANYTLPETKKGARPKFKYLGEVNAKDTAGVDPELAEVEQVLKDAEIDQGVAATYFKEVGASTPEEKLVAAKELAQELTEGKEDAAKDAKKGAKKQG